MVVDDDGFVGEEAGFGGNFFIGADAGGDDDHITQEDGAVFEFVAADAAVGVGDDFGGGFGAVGDHAEGFNGFLARTAASLGIKLDGHEVGGHFNDVDEGAMGHEAFGGFKAKQAAADHGGSSGLFGPLGDAFAVVQCAEDEHTLKIDAGDRRDKRTAAGGEDEFVVMDLGSTGEHELGVLAGCADGLGAFEEGDVVLRTTRRC